MTSTARVYASYKRNPVRAFWNTYHSRLRQGVSPPVAWAQAARMITRVIVELGPCVECGRPGEERHHPNIVEDAFHAMSVCRFCHSMVFDSKKRG